MNDETFDDQEMNEEGSFAEMFEQSMVGKTQLEPGQKIDAKILQIGNEWVFLDVGQKGEGVLDRKELLDEEGNLTVAVGDQLGAYFMSRKGGEMRFTTRVSAAVLPERHNLKKPGAMRSPWKVASKKRSRVATKSSYRAMSALSAPSLSLVWADRTIRQKSST